jgi:phenylacetate-CoA ligase
MTILDSGEMLSLEELRALQFSRLRATLAHAHANNPVYRAKFDKAGLTPNDLSTLEDLHKFPFTTKSDLRDAYPFGFFAAPMEKIARIHASSGTTGKPTVVGYTANDIANWSALMARARSAPPGEGRA